MSVRAVVVVLLLAACSSSSSSDSAPAGADVTLVLRVTADGVPVGARVQLYDAAGEPVRIGVIDMYGARQAGAACAIAPGVVGTWAALIVAPQATAEIPIGRDTCKPSPAIKPGRYHVAAWHGLEYERWEGDVDLSAGRGRVELAIPLERAWTPRGTLSADLHVHAHGSNDSTMPDTQRVLAQVAAGIQVVGVSNHNSAGSLDEAIRSQHLEGVIAAIPSIELTADALHAGAYPVTPDQAPAPEAVLHTNAAQMFALGHALPGSPLIQLNHPRFRVTALFDGLRWDGVAWPPPFPRGFDTIEVINGFTAFNVAGDRRLDDSARDYHTLIDHGWLVTALGNSDSHDFNWVHDGTARSYVRVPDARTEPFDQAAFVAALRGHRTIATSGPWLEVTVAPHQGGAAVGPGDGVAAEDGAVWLEVTMAQARFVHVERITITIGSPTGPTVVQRIAVPAGVRSHGWQGRVEVGAADTWISVTADGDDPLPLDQTGTYQRDKWKHPGVTPFAITSPVLIDGDGDGRWRRGDSDIALP